MVHPILMPKPGQMTEECTLIAWHLDEGDQVHKGDLLFEIETDKANMDVEAFDDGVLLKRCVADGQTVPVSTVCGYVGAPGEAVPEAAAGLTRLVKAPAVRPPVPAVGAASASVPEEIAVPAPEPPTVAAAAPPAATTVSGGRIPISPRASRLAAEAGIDPRGVVGTGPGGRISERDIRAVMAAGPAPASAASAAERAAPTEPAATPERGAVPERATPPEPAAASPTVANPDEDPPQPLSRMRRVIAARLTQSWTSIPQFTVTVAADVTSLLALRRELKAAGSAVTVTDFVLAATARTLVEFPDVNARTDGVSIWRRSRVHLGVAVSLPAGLVVPVIRDADWWSVAEIHERAAALAEAAREGRLSVDDMTGSTFSVTNMGMYDVEEFSAIINPGESAILAVSSAIDTAAAMNGGLAIRSIMKLTLSADHRLIDGATGARFLNAIRRRLEDAATLRDWALNV